MQPLNVNALVIAAVVLALTACKPKLDDLAVWKQSFPSPTGAYIASAETIQNGGFGSASIETIVEVRSIGTQSGVTVLALNCDGPVPRPYILDNVANSGGTVDLKVQWIDATHLRLTYRKHPTVEASAPQAYKVLVTAENVT